MAQFVISTKEKFWVKPTYGNINIDTAKSGSEILDSKEKLSILTKNGYVPIKSKLFCFEQDFYNMKYIGADGNRITIISETTALEDFDAGKILRPEQIKEYDRDFVCVVISALIRNCSGLHFKLSQVILNKLSFQNKITTGAVILETDSTNIVSESGLICFNSR